MTCCPNCGHTLKAPKFRHSLTSEQKRLLEFIKLLTLENGGIAPSYDEMASFMGLNSKSGIHRLVTALEERGRIRRIPAAARSIIVIREAA